MPEARPQSLAGRKALVVGAETPAGGAIARAFAAAGADVALCALTADEAVLAVRGVRRAVQAMGRTAIEYVMDVTLGKNVQVTTRQVVKELGGLDVVACTSDRYLAAPIAKTSDSELQRVMQVNFAAHFFMVRTAADEFRRAGHPGRIVLVAGASHDPAAGEAAYASAVGAVAGFARAAARELAPDGITVNLIAPVEAAGGGAAGTEDPPDLGALALRLVADTSEHAVTGQVFALPGQFPAGQSGSR